MLKPVMFNYCASDDFEELGEAEYEGCIDLDKMVDENKTLYYSYDKIDK